MGALAIATAGSRLLSCLQNALEEWSRASGLCPPPPGPRTGGSEPRASVSVALNDTASDTVVTTVVSHERSLVFLLQCFQSYWGNYKTTESNHCTTHVKYLQSCGNNLFTMGGS